MRDILLDEEHFCGDFPGAGGYPLRNKINLTHIEEYDHSEGATFPVPGFYWFNLKEGTGTPEGRGGGPFSSSWHAYEDAFRFYPDMAKGDLHKRWLKLTPVERVPTRRGRRMVK